jgi:hypothetical protein
VAAAACSFSKTSIGRAVLFHVQHRSPRKEAHFNPLSSYAPGCGRPFVFNPYPWGDDLDARVLYGRLDRVNRRRSHCTSRGSGRLLEDFHGGRGLRPNGLAQCLPLIEAGRRPRALGLRLGYHSRRGAAIRDMPDRRLYETVIQFPRVCGSPVPLWPRIGSGKLKSRLATAALRRAELTRYASVGV